MGIMICPSPRTRQDQEFLDEKGLTSKPTFSILPGTYLVGESQSNPSVLLFCVSNSEHLDLPWLSLLPLPGLLRLLFNPPPLHLSAQVAQSPRLLSPPQEKLLVSATAFEHK